MIPLYGFLQGDTMGVLLLASESETISALAEKLQSAASMRVRRRRCLQVYHKGRQLPLESTVASVRLVALDRIDVVSGEDSR
jgi:hypothetical protein